MTRVGVDTNVVISFVTERDAAQQDRAARLFRLAVRGSCRIIVPQTVAIECVYVLGNVYGLEVARVRAILGDLLSLPGVDLANEIDWEFVWRCWPSPLTDFGDACMAAVAHAGAFAELATFDRAFAARARRLGVASYWKSG